MDPKELVEMLLNAITETAQWKFLESLMQEADAPKSPDAGKAQLSRRNANYHGPAVGVKRYAAQAPKQLPATGKTPRLPGGSAAVTVRDPDEEKFRALSKTDPVLLAVSKRMMLDRHKELLAQGKYATSAEIQQWMRQNWPALVRKYLEEFRLVSLEGQLESVSRKYAKEKADRPNPRHDRVMAHQRSMHRSGKYLSYAEAEAAIGV
jgi:hypothetical protein